MSTSDSYSPSAVLHSAGTCHACTISSGAPRRFASAAATSRAANDACEPSTPTTTALRRLGRRGLRDDRHGSPSEAAGQAGSDGPPGRPAMVRAADDDERVGGESFPERVDRRAVHGLRLDVEVRMRRAKAAPRRPSTSSARLIVHRSPAGTRSRSPCRRWRERVSAGTHRSVRRPIPLPPVIPAFHPNLR